MTDPTARNAENATAETENTAAEPAPRPEFAEQPDPVAEAKREAFEYKDKLLRTLAEMENLRKRTEREVADARLYGIRKFALDVLNVADNMHRALGTLSAEAREAADAAIKGVLEGVELTERELLKTLEKNGVKKFSPEGEKFDPNIHQAMYEVPNADVPAGHVAQVIQSGYMIGDRVLRPALVGVSKPQAKPAAKPSANENSPTGDAGK